MFETAMALPLTDNSYHFAEKLVSSKIDPTENIVTSTPIGTT